MEWIAFGKPALGLIAAGFLLGGPIGMQGAEAPLKVAVYNANQDGGNCLGEQAIFTALQTTAGIKPDWVTDLSAAKLLDFDCLVVPVLSKIGNEDSDWKEQTACYVKLGGGILLLHNNVGFRYEITQSLFPSLMQGEARSENRAMAPAAEPRNTGDLTPGAPSLLNYRHPVVRGLSAFPSTYYDHIVIRPGPDAEVILRDGDQKVVGIAGCYGAGRVVGLGLALGIDARAQPQAVAGAEKELLVNAVRWIRRSPENAVPASALKTRAAEELAAVKIDLRQAQDQRLEKLREMRGDFPGGIMDARRFLTVQGGMVTGPVLVLEKPGACVVYPVYIERAGQYRIMFRELAEKGEGELLVRGHVFEQITGQKSKYVPAFTQSSTYIAQHDGQWRWQEMVNQYFALEEGWYLLRLEFAGREENKPGRVQIDALTVSPIKRPYSTFVLQFEKRISSEKLDLAARMKALKFRMAQVQYSQYIRADQRGTAAKASCLMALTRIIDRDLAPNGLNWLALGVGFGPRMTNNYMVTHYLTKIPWLTSLVTEAEDALPEIIAQAHAKGIKVAFYLPVAFNMTYGLPPEKRPPVSDHQMELAVSREALEKYRLDGLMYEDPADPRQLAADLKKLRPEPELFICGNSLEWTIKEKIGWNFITMRNISFPEEIFPPIVCLYAGAYDPIMNPIEYHDLLARALRTPGLEGIYVYLYMPGLGMGPYCDVIGDIYHYADGLAETAPAR